MDHTDKILIDSLSYDLDLNRGKTMPYNAHDLRSLFTLAGQIPPPALARCNDRTIDFAVDTVARLVRDIRENAPQ
jgi:hypothetical protein